MNSEAIIKGNENIRLFDVPSIIIAQESFLRRRLSTGRMKRILADRIKEGRIVLNNPAIIVNWSYENVQIEGIQTANYNGKRALASVLLSQIPLLLHFCIIKKNGLFPAIVMIIILIFIFTPVRFYDILILSLQERGCKDV